MVQKVAIELTVFLESAKLPKEMRFKDWGSGSYKTFPASPTCNYLDSTLIAIERISDGMLAQFEITSLRNIDNPELILIVSDLAAAIDKAIAELS